MKRKQPPTMSDLEMKRYMDALLERYKRDVLAMEAVRLGAVEILRVEVKSYRVAAYTVGKHMRHVRRRRDTAIARRKSA